MAYIEKTSDCKKRTVDCRAPEPTSDQVWRCICQSAGIQFRTSGRGSRPGVAFTYSISAPGGAGGRHYAGESIDGFGNEMIVHLSSGEQKKKTISRSTVDLALARVLEMGGEVKGPRALNIPGAHSYLFPVFVQLGLIDATL